MGLLERLERERQNRVVDDTVGINSTYTSVYIDEFAQIKEKVHKDIIELINREVERNENFENIRDEFIRESLEDLINEHSYDIPRNERARLIRQIYDNVVGLGPLEPLLDDPDITEIMVNGPHRVYVERRGKIEISSTKFKDKEHVIHVIGRIVATVGRHIDEASPMVDARLPDGSRFNAVIPPLALNGPIMTIRKFSKKPFTVNDLVKFSSISPKMIAFLGACVRGKLNIIVSGGTGSGKTTLLNVLSGYIPDNERIITIEDAAELQLRQEHVVTLESRPANLEGSGRISIRDLVVNSLRMRPDRIIVGEVRSDETLDMLQAMNTGHEGSMTTAHANSPRELMSRLETMVLMAGMDLSTKAIRDQISSAIDIIVHQSRMRDGSRKVVSITEVVGMEGDTVTLQEIFSFKSEGIDQSGKLLGTFHATGVRPGFLEKLYSGGVHVKDEWFLNER